MNVPGESSIWQRPTVAGGEKKKKTDRMLLGNLLPLGKRIKVTRAERPIRRGPSRAHGQIKRDVGKPRVRS